MLLLVRTSDRALLQFGDFTLDAVPAGAVIETDTDILRTQIERALEHAPYGLKISPDHANLTVLPAPPPDPAVTAMRTQRIADAMTILNSPAVTITQATRDAMARTIQVQPLTIPLTQQAVTADIHPLGW